MQTHTRQDELAGAQQFVHTKGLLAQWRKQVRWRHAKDGDVKRLELAHKEAVPVSPAAAVPLSVLQLSLHALQLPLHPAERLLGTAPAQLGLVLVVRQILEGCLQCTSTCSA